ncbi:MAG: type II toxin-antitoxin system Phd/YefM family antitoxin [Anaerolineae bacterium]
MEEVGVRELKARASEIIREVRERRARYVVSVRGCPAAVLLPIEAEPAPKLGSLDECEADPWSELERLGHEIGKDWRSPLTSVELLSQMRH